MGNLRAAPFFAALAMIASLTACGFTPVYGPDMQMDQKLSDIEIAPPVNRVGFLFVRNLEERIGYNPNAGKLLEYDILVFEDGLEVIGAARSQVVGKVTYKVTSQTDGEVITTGFVESFTAYTPSAQGFKAHQRDANERLMQTLADRTITDLTLRLSR
ncbi:hypothetical protein [Roseovarius sp. D0-M9]|uniref:hypothetical protein n=1 Tax=Roseovarius sp. D0-M9 TaxID=3127117 RepID=UPI003010142F